MKSGIKSFFTPKTVKKDDIITIDDSSSSNSNENSSSSSNVSSTLIGSNNNDSSKKDNISKPIHPLFQKASAKKDVVITNTTSSRKKSVAATPSTTDNNSTSTRPKRSCANNDIIISIDDDDDEYEDPFAEDDDDDGIVIEEKPKRQPKTREGKDNSIGIIIITIKIINIIIIIIFIAIISSKPPKEFFMSAEEKQRQKEIENEQLEKMKGIEMQKKFKNELRENAKKFEVKGTSSSNVNSFFMSNTYSNKNKCISINLVDDDIIIDNTDDYYHYPSQPAVGLPSLSDYLKRTTDSNIVWRDKSVDIVEIEESTDTSTIIDLASPSQKYYIDLNVDIKVSQYHTIENVGHNDYRNLWSHFLAFNERNAQEISSFTPISQDNSPLMFEPQNTSQIVGNRREVKKFLNWLEYLGGKRRAGKKKRKSRSRRSLDDDDLEAQISKVMVVMGQSGSGKTSAVYACAREAGFKVIEINASQDRSGTGIRKLFSEAAQSHGVGVETGSHELNLILFDDADLVFDEDAHMHSAMKDLLKNSKSPVIITTETPLQFLNAIPHEKIILQKLNSPEISVVIKNALTATQLTSPVPEDILVLLGMLSNGDSRACLTCMQLMMSALAHQSIQSCTFTSFMDWIHRANVDFAQFDNSNKLINTILKKEEMLTHATRKLDRIPARANIIAPLVTSSEPRKGLVAGGFVVTIYGKHFLQHQISDHYKNPNESMSVSVYLDDILCDCVVMSDTQIKFRAPQVSQPGVYPIIIKITDGLVTDTKVRCVTSDLCGIAGGWIQLESKRKLITSYYQPIKKASTTISSKRGKRKSFSPEDDPIEEFDDDDDDDFVAVPKKTKGKKRIMKKEKKAVESDDELLDDNANSEVKTNINKRTKRIIDDEIDSDTNIAQETKSTSSLSSPLADVSSSIEEKSDFVKVNELGSLDEKIYQCMVTVCSRLQKHKLSEVFRFPVSEEEAPGYHDIITKPMDLSTIEQSLNQSKYYNNECDITGFVNDIRQIWINCKTYNKPTSDIVKLADVLNDFFEKEMLAVFRALMNDAIAVSNKGITINDNKVFTIFDDDDDDSNPDKLEELPVIDSKSIRDELNAAFLSRSQMSVSISRDVGLEFENENEGVVPVHTMLQLRKDDCKCCLMALEETWRLRDAWSSAELLGTTASNLISNLIEDDDYLDYHDYQTPQQLSIASFDIMKLSSSILQSSARNALKDADKNIESSTFLQYLIDDIEETTEDTTEDTNMTQTNTIEAIEKPTTIDDRNKAINIDDDTDQIVRKSRKSPKISDSDDEEVNFDEDDDDDDEEEEDDEEDDDVDINTKDITSSDDQYIKRWYDLGKELGNTFIRFSIRKKAYIDFVANKLCNTESGLCDYSIFKFSKNMKRNSLSSMMALDIIPIVARMLHSEAMHYEEKSLNNRYGDIQRTRRGKNNSKYNYVSNATLLPESTLSSLLEFGFISSPRVVGYGEDKPKWM